jgi:hypothetical protein
MNRRYPDAGDDDAKADRARIDPTTIFAACPRQRLPYLAEIK